MGLFEVLLLAVGLAMDAFAVSICKGLAAGKVTKKEYLLCGVWFGVEFYSKDSAWCCS